MSEQLKSIARGRQKSSAVLPLPYLCARTSSLILFFLTDFSPAPMLREMKDPAMTNSEGKGDEMN